MSSLPPPFSLLFTSTTCSVCLFRRRLGVSYFSYLLWLGTWGTDRMVGWGLRGGFDMGVPIYFIFIVIFCFVACTLSIEDGRMKESLNIMINKNSWGFCFVVLLAHPYAIFLKRLGPMYCASTFGIGSLGGCSNFLGPTHRQA